MFLKIILIITITILTIIATDVFAITIENKTFTVTQYSTLKNKLIDNYKTKGFFTLNEWQTYAAVLNWEAKQGNLKKIRVSGNLHNNLMEKIYAK